MKQRRIYPTHFGFSLWLGFFILGRFLASCETQENPLLKVHLDKQQWVYEAEKRSEQISWCIHDSLNTFDIPLWGLDDLYHTEKSKSTWPTIKTLGDHIQKIPLNPSEKQNIIPLLENYELQQNILLDRAKSSIQESELQFLDQKNLILLRLNRNEINIVQYDSLITIRKKTILEKLRHTYNESSIWTTSSVQLHHVLGEIQRSISDKSWDRLRSTLTGK
jgi:hypothetical protein